VVDVEATPAHKPDTIIYRSSQADCAMPDEGSLLSEYTDSEDRS
jgi:hypothetical protein